MAGKNDKVVYVLNGCYGGFGLSPEIVESLKKSGLDCNIYSDSTALRTDPRLVKIVEEEIHELCFNGTDLEIRYIPREYFESGFWRLEEYDGVESIELDHNGFQQYMEAKKLREQMNEVKDLKQKLLKILNGNGSNEEKVALSKELLQNS
jgi:hypothetical protein